MLTILAADIGGTHCRFALFEAEPDNAEKPLLRIKNERWIPSADYASFADVLAALKEYGSDREPPIISVDHPAPQVAILAPAGPIRGEECHLSNVSWAVKAEDVRSCLGIRPVHLINDFAAQAYACLMPENIDVIPIIDGQAVPEAPVAIIGAGTGFGTALLLRGSSAAAQADNDRKSILQRFCTAQVLPCEGGHALFPFIGKREHEFAYFTAEREGTDKLIGDHIITGKGLAHIFAFHTGRSLPQKEATSEALNEKKVIEDFARFYGRAARNFVLSSLALGGLYITGGMAMRLPVLTHPAFTEELYNSGTQRPLMQGLPVWHVRKAHSGLWGAALYGLLRLVMAKPCS